MELRWDRFHLLREAGSWVKPPANLLIYTDNKGHWYTGMQQLVQHGVIGQGDWIWDSFTNAWRPFIDRNVRREILDPFGTARRVHGENSWPRLWRGLTMNIEVWLLLVMTVSFCVGMVHADEGDAARQLRQLGTSSLALKVTLHGVHSGSFERIKGQGRRSHSSQGIAATGNHQS